MTEYGDPKDNTQAERINNTMKNELLKYMRFTCIQGIIPYGAQLLMAGGLASIPSTAIMPYLFYPLLAFCSLMAIIFRYPRLTAKLKD